MTVLVTGAAGFIGFSVARRLLRQGERVYGIDNLSPYYDIALKRARLGVLENEPGFRFELLDLADRDGMAALFRCEAFDRIVHLGAQVGVRYSLEAPLYYVDANLTGFAHVLEGALKQKVDHLVFASSSSVYGANRKLPFAESDNVDHPITLYAATKKSNELTAHSYAHLFGLPCTGLRFFTVYGPWGRPDMALFKFTRLILAGEPIPVYNGGHMVRDVTYIDDVVEATLRLLAMPPSKGTGDGGDDSDAPYRIFNVGNGQPVELLDYIRALETALDIEARLDLLPMQPGDIDTTLADTSKLEGATGFRPSTPMAEGVRRFVEWYLAHYRDELAARSAKPA